MNTISESFEIILKKQHEWNYLFPRITRKPASMQDILNIESALEITFNNELRELYLFADGTDIDNITPCGLTGLIPIHNFLSLENAVQYYNMSITFEENFHNWEQDFQVNKKLFPFLEDGAGNCYWVDLNERTNNYGQIFWTNTFGQDPDYTYTSLTNMFNVIAECYKTGIITIDNEGYLTCDYDAFRHLSRAYNPELLFYTDNYN
jgi:cell wall assembly regulator SMI1